MQAGRFLHFHDRSIILGLGRVKTLPYGMNSHPVAPVGGGALDAPLPPVSGWLDNWIVGNGLDDCPSIGAHDVPHPSVFERLVRGPRIRRQTDRVATWSRRGVEGAAPYSRNWLVCCGKLKELEIIGNCQLSIVNCQRQSPPLTSSPVLASGISALLSSGHRLDSWWN